MKQPRGKAGGLTEQQLESCPLDIDAKRADVHSQAWPSSDSEDEELNETIKQSSTQPSSSSLPLTSFTGRLGSALNSTKPPTLGEKERKEEQWIETKDEFGRDILVLASEIELKTQDPQRTMAFAQTESASHLKEIDAQSGPQTSFPDLPTQPIKKPALDEPLEKYFDPKAERRQLGTGFYALSSDPAERQRQQMELRAREAQTEEARAATGTKDVKQLSATELTLESRKRQIQLKREEQMRKRSKAEGSKLIDPPL